MNREANIMNVATGLPLAGVAPAMIRADLDVARWGDHGMWTLMLALHRRFISDGLPLPLPWSIVWADTAAPVLLICPDACGVYRADSGYAYIKAEFIVCTRCHG